MAVEKKVLPIDRMIALRFKFWLSKHPDAPLDKQIAKFDKIADELMGR